MNFAKHLLSWYETNGRKNLPWRNHINPYRIWLSEIMLQQTQVTTVLPYFEKFLQHYPNIQSLATASIDDVLHLWSGLGYYSRARNLHKSAQKILKEFDGQFPDNLNELINLPGIGLSTAGAILAIAFEKKASILDGNVKRVLSRYFAITTWPGLSHVQKQLWSFSEQLTPSYNVRDYTQAIMDLGATVCVRKKPHCDLCPVKKNCQAAQKNLQNSIPILKPKKIIPLQKIYMFLIIKNNTILLYKRPPVGIWGGLWSLPECVEIKNYQDYCNKHFGLECNLSQELPAFTHKFSHFHLYIQPIILTVKKTLKMIAEKQGQWFNQADIKTLALPAPIKTLLNNIEVHL